MKQLLNQYKPLITLFTLVLVLFALPGFVLAQESIVWGIVANVFGLFVAMAGGLLDFAVREFVIGFGDIYVNNGIGLAVDTVWVNVRDIFNITFIFGLIYIGFKMILDSSNSETQRWLVNLIMAALLVNFSLFFTKVVIDVSNTIATEIVQTGFQGVTISEFFIDQIGLGVVFGIDSKTLGNIATEASMSWGFIFSSMIMLTVLTFVLASGAMLLIIRFAVLLFYMVLSPFMFIGWVFPQLQKYTTEYWTGFLGRAFFAPLYLLFVYLSAQIIEKYFVSFGNPNLGAATGQSGGANFQPGLESTLPPFILASVFLIMSLVIANKLGANGASAVISAGKGMSQKFRGAVQRGAGNATLGLGGVLGRRSIGALSNKAAENASVQRWARTKGAKGFLGRVAANTAHRGRTASFDVRTVAGLGTAAGIGTGKKGGYANTQKEKEKIEKERSERYSTVEDDQLYEDAGQGVADIKQNYDQIIKNINQTVSDLSKVTEPGERERLTDRLRDQEGEKRGIENDNGAGSDGGRFNNIRKNNKQIRLNQYAETVERRGENLGPFRHFLTDQQSNTRSANAIRKEKTDLQKLTDFLGPQGAGGGGGAGGGAGNVPGP